MMIFLDDYDDFSRWLNDDIDYDFLDNMIIFLDD